MHKKIHQPAVLKLGWWNLLQLVSVITFVISNKYVPTRGLNPKSHILMTRVSIRAPQGERRL